MFFVFLSHFTFVYFHNDSGTYRVVPWLYYIAQIASPTFVVISGIMLGLLYETHRLDFIRTRSKYVVRGLFLLTVGRVLILIAHIAAAGGFLAALHWWFITDTLGICMIFGPPIVARVKPIPRILLALTCIGVSSIVTLVWNPADIGWRIVREVLFGETYVKAVLREFFPLLPWFGLYLLGSVIGERVGTYHRNGDGRSLTSYIFRLMATGLAIVFLLKGISFFLAYWRLAPALTSLMGVTQKRPPTPLYFLAYGSLGLLILYVYLRFGETNRVVRMIAELTRMSGQNSLLAFILQYYMYFTVLALLDLPYTNAWPVFFFITVALNLVIARIWLYRKFKEFLGRIEARAVAKIDATHASAIL